MKTYNNFNEMFNANKSVKSDLSVFNVKVSAETGKLIDQFSDMYDEKLENLRKSYAEKYGLEYDPDEIYLDRDHMKMERAVSRKLKDFELNCPLRRVVMDSICNDFFLDENQAEYPIDMEYGARDVVNAEYIDNYAKDVLDEVDMRCFFSLDYMDIATQLSEQIFGE